VYSRLAYTKLLTDENAAIFNFFLIRAAGWVWKAWGVTINLVMTERQRLQDASYS
jgi:hypothetical protein